MAKFEVLRHGGRSNNTWRVMLSTEDEAKAVKKFERENVRLRQGGLRLVKDGDIVRKSGAPLLRTRW